MSLRYGADLGRSRLVFKLNANWEEVLVREVVLDEFNCCTCLFSDEIKACLQQARVSAAVGGGGGSSVETSSDAEEAALRKDMENEKLK